MTVDASKEMLPQISLYLDGKKDEKFHPTTMGAFAFGNEIILLSNWKGGKKFLEYFEPSYMSNLLQKCTATFQAGLGPETPELLEGNGENDHRWGGHCAEVMAFHMYARQYPEQPLPFRTDKPRAVTIKIRDGEIMDPCGDSERVRSLTPRVENPEKLTCHHQSSAVIGWFCESASLTLTSSQSLSLTT
jgi:hypothetical protein